MYHQPIQHQSQIGVGNAPFPEQIILAVTQQLFDGGNQLVGGTLRGVGQWRKLAVNEHCLGRPLGA
ncbi:hypothetical protein D3C76_1822830 [compost metagenome]